jgi:RsiW-degrading membrane proteinase PrsW (M82 family)
MQVSAALPFAVALLPVAAFLATLLYLDSYKLVRLRVVLVVVMCGAALALAGYGLNALLLRASGLDFTSYTRYASPVVEEVLKALAVVALIATRRVGFLVDATILGFAVGTGFSIFENLYYLERLRDAAFGTWIVRGFGTALMHGGATALLALVSLALVARAGRVRAVALAPGLVVAIALHAAFNHLLGAPTVATVAMIVVLPLLLHVVFERSNRTMTRWLGPGFDADAEMLELIKSGRFSDSPIGHYLHALKHKFAGPVVADMLCYLRLYTELSLRAKGLLLMRESGFEVPVDAEAKAKFEEMRYLERSIGRTALLTMQPMMHMSQKELWQLYTLEE